MVSIGRATMCMVAPIVKVPALRLGRFFGMSPQFWLNLQNRYDLEMTEDLLEGRLDDEVHALVRE